MSVARISAPWTASRGLLVVVRVPGWGVVFLEEFMRESIGGGMEWVEGVAMEMWTPSFREARARSYLFLLVYSRAIDGVDGAWKRTYKTLFASPTHAIFSPSSPNPLFCAPLPTRSA